MAQSRPLLAVTAVIFACRARLCDGASHEMVTRSQPFTARRGGAASSGCPGGSHCLSRTVPARESVVLPPTSPLAHDTSPPSSTTAEHATNTTNTTTAPTATPTSAAPTAPPPPQCKPQSGCSDFCASQSTCVQWVAAANGFPRCCTSETSCLACSASYGCTPTWPDPCTPAAWPSLAVVNGAITETGTGCADHIAECDEVVADGYCAAEYGYANYCPVSCDVCSASAPTANCSTLAPFCGSDPRVAVACPTECTGCVLAPPPAPIAHPPTPAPNLKPPAPTPASQLWCGLVDNFPYETPIAYYDHSATQAEDFFGRLLRPGCHSIYAVCDVSSTGLAAAAAEVAANPSVFVVSLTDRTLESMPPFPAGNVLGFVNVSILSLGATDLGVPGARHLFAFVAKSLTRVENGSFATLDGKWQGLTEETWAQGATFLLLDGGGLTVLPDFTGMGGVSLLGVTNHPITRVSTGALDGITSLYPYQSVVDFKDNQISVVESGAFANPNISGLMGLTLANNVLTLVEPEGFRGLTDLMVLDLSANALAKVPSFIGMDFTTQNAEELGCGVRIVFPPDYSGGPARNFPPSITVAISTSNAATTSILDLSFNKLTRATAADFPEGWGAGLCFLGLNANKLTQIELQQFVSLQTLNISDSGLGRIANASLPSSLTQLYLHDNNFTVIEAGGFKGMVGLKTLDLASSGLLSIPRGVFADLISVAASYTFRDPNVSADTQDFVEVLTVQPNPAVCVDQPVATAPATNLSFFRVIGGSFSSFPDTSCEVVSYGSCVAFFSSEHTSNCTVELLQPATLSVPSSTPVVQRGNAIVNSAQSGTWPDPFSNTFAALSSANGTVKGRWSTTYAIPGLKVAAGDRLTLQLYRPSVFVCAAEGAAINLSAIVCDTCVAGYAYNATSQTCSRPPFAPRPGWHPPGAANGGENAVGILPKVLRVNTTYVVPAPPGLTPVGEAFVGYSDHDPDLIRYELAVDSDQAEIGCGDVKIGSTVGGRNSFYYPSPGWMAGTTTNCNNVCVSPRWPLPEPIHYPEAPGALMCNVATGGSGICAYHTVPISPENISDYPAFANETYFPSWDCVATPTTQASFTLPGVRCPYLYDSPDVSFTFSLERPGLVTFDTCLSDYATSIAVFNASTNPPTLVYPDGNRTLDWQYNLPVLPPGPAADPYTRLRIPAELGCPLSTAANVTFNMTSPGEYLVVVDGGLAWNGRRFRFDSSDFAATRSNSGLGVSGQYILKMGCRGGAATKAAHPRPGGMSVDTTTGAVVAVPQQPGKYTVNLTAVDGSGATTTVQRWNFTVVGGAFGLRQPFSYDRIASTPILAINQTMAFETPLSAATNLSAAVAEYFGNYTAPVRFQLVHDRGAIPAQGDFLIDTSTGYMEARPKTPITSTTLSLLAADQSGASLTLTTFTVAAQLLDTADCRYGPGGRCCVHGKTVDAYMFDHAFSCDCTGTVYSGPRCDIPVLWLAVSSTIVLVAAASFLVWRYLKRWWRRWQPTDYSALQLELLADFGLLATFDIAEHEIGLAFSLGGLECDLSGGTAETVALPDAVAKGLTAAIKQHVGQLAVWSPSTELRLSDIGTGEATVVLQRHPKATGAVGDQVLRKLRRAVEVYGIEACGVRVLEVSLITPRRLPPVIDRETVHRLEQLGEGVSSVVFKVQVAPKRARRPFLAACKEPYPGARGAIEKEAALMAMLGTHANIVQMIGLVETSARSPTQLLLLEYCEHGPLEGYVQSEDAKELSTMMKLSFCADIAAGMDYLSSRRVVHRDLAARNVLLDSVFNCKVADFGMSVLLSKRKQRVGGEVEYSSNYIRVRGELPIRWASIEVLTEAKYSTASDVWAYGVTTWEIFSHGARPYSEIASLDVVGERIKAGVTLGRLDECPEQVHAQLVAPCFGADPQGRPSFAELHRCAFDLGGQASGLTLDNPAPSPVVNSGDKLMDSSAYPPHFWRSLEGLKLRGVSVGHIATKLLPETRVRTRQPFLVAGKPTHPPAEEDITVGHAVWAAVVPQSAQVPCPRDGALGCAYVDTLRSLDDAGPASALLSYSWTNVLPDVVHALESWVGSRDRDPARTYIWMCALCLNQHRVLSTTQSSQALALEFGPRVVQIGRLLPLLSPYNAPKYTTRAWCLFELYTAIRHRIDVEINIILPPSQVAALSADMVTGQLSALDDALASIDARRAVTSRPKDLEAIREYVRELPGGFDTLNEVVKTHLRNWLRQQGAVMEAPRMSLRRRSMVSEGSLTPKAHSTSMPLDQPTNALPPEMQVQRAMSADVPELTAYTDYRSSLSQPSPLNTPTSTPPPDRGSPRPRATSSSRLGSRSQSPPEQSMQTREADHAPSQLLAMDVMMNGVNTKGRRPIYEDEPALPSEIAHNETSI